MSKQSAVDYDLIIIGGGPGGYHAAQLAAADGHSVVLIEREAVGGTCLNWGCIPTKTLLNIAKQISYSKQMTARGLAGALEYRHQAALQWKDTVVATLHGHVTAMLKRGKVTVINGSAQLEEISAHKKTVRVIDSSGDVGGDTKKSAVAVQKGTASKKSGACYTATNLIIANGVESFIPPIAGLADSGAMTSREILSLDAIPQQLAIIGGGVIGIEFASLFSQLGSSVTVFEALTEILPMMDNETVRILKEELVSEYGVRFLCSATVTEVGKQTVHYTAADGTTGSCPFDALLVSVGRRAELASFADAGLAVTKSSIVVDEQLRTNIPGVYAIGDIAGSFQLAHVAYRMAEVAVDAISGRSSRMRYHAVPMVVYSHPELASCGVTEAAAEDAGRPAVAASLPIAVSGRAIAEHGATVRGLCKIVADASDGTVLGIHLVAPMASEIISTAAVILETELRVQELAEIILPHPTVGEVLRNVSALLARKIKKAS